MKNVTIFGNPYALKQEDSDVEDWPPRLKGLKGTCYLEWKLVICLNVIKKLQCEVLEVLNVIQIIQWDIQLKANNIGTWANNSAQIAQQMDSCNGQLSF
jgi:hypothetical protein